LGPLLLRLLWLSLLGPLLLRLLSGLLLLLLCVLCLRPLRLCLRALLLCGWPRTLLWLALLLFRLGLFFLLVLRVRRDNRPEKHKQGSGTDSSKELHSKLSPLRSL
jgi:type VI protein secretion system component VasK